MGGVTILQTIPQYESTWGWNWYLIIPIIGIVGMIALAIVSCTLLRFPGGAGIASMCAVALLLLLVALMADAKTVFTHNQYQVLIDESVSMTEFSERYSIIEQQGITYIVEEKVIE